MVELNCNAAYSMICTGRLQTYKFRRSRGAMNSGSSCAGSQGTAGELLTAKGQLLGSLGADRSMECLV